MNSRMERITPVDEAAAEAADAVPAVHALQLGDPVLCWYVPGTQPAHALDAVLPVAGSDEPLAHGVQLGWAVSDWYKPAAHGVHAAAPAPENAPTGQPTQVPDAAAPVTVA
jgi:hypothetical protein